MSRIVIVIRIVCLTCPKLQTDLAYSTRYLQHEAMALTNNFITAGCSKHFDILPVRRLDNAVVTATIYGAEQQRDRNSSSSM
jgi:hypothetical protein